MDLFTRVLDTLSQPSTIITLTIGFLAGLTFNRYSAGKDDGEDGWNEVWGLMVNYYISLN